MSWGHRRPGADEFALKSRVLDEAARALMKTVRVDRAHDVPYVGSCNRRGDRHALKSRFAMQLGETVATLASRFELILIGDRNVSQTHQDTFPRLRTEEPHASSRRGFAQDFAARRNRVDAFRVVHPQAREYTWFSPIARAASGWTRHAWISR